MTYREHTRAIRIGNTYIGGGHPVTVQSMTNTKTEDAGATIDQILRLERAGCEIIRSTCPTEAAALSFKKIKEAIHIPIVADIHFDYRMAIAAIENGADAIRINPGNIGSMDRIKAVVMCAKAHRVPMRVGVNSGSLEKELVSKYGGVTAEGLVESALDAGELAGLLGHLGEDRLSASRGNHGGRHGLLGQYQVLGGPRHHPARGNRRHDPRLPDRRSGGGDQNR